MSVVCVIMESPDNGGFYAHQWQEIRGQLCDRVSCNIYPTPDDLKAALRLHTFEWEPWRAHREDAPPFSTHP